MKRITTRLANSGFQFVMLAMVLGHSLLAAPAPYFLEILPPEDRRMIDPKTGAELLFLSTSREKDSNLYFHERSWLADESVILFTSSRPKGGLMGYLTATGELIRF